VAISVRREVVRKLVRTEITFLKKGGDVAEVLERREYRNQTVRSCAMMEDKKTRLFVLKLF
jgi:hypothetical protein